MVWFKRKDRKVITETKDKKEIPEGLWYKCPKCKIVVSSDEHIKSLWVCQNCNHHERINAIEYFSFLFDEGKFIEMDKNIFSIDPLNFSDTKKYTERLQTNIEKTKLNEAVNLNNLLRDFPKDRGLIFCNENDKNLPNIFNALENKSSIFKKWAILIGPEGGFSETETKEILSISSTIPVSLGKRILRSDTATTVALFAVQSLVEQ